MEDRSQIWQLRRGDEPIADLVVVGADYPWLQAHVEPAPAFDEVKHVFADDLAQLESDEDDTWPTAGDQIRTTFTLITPAGTPVADFLLHIDGESAWWRWLD
jgi:hypothetical protein